MVLITITTKPADEPGPLAQSAWNIFKDLPTFDIHNGDVSDVRTVFIKATVPQMYHWVSVEGVQAEDALKTLDDHTGNAPSSNDCILDADLIPGKKAAPYLTARISRIGEVTYTPRQELRTNPLFTTPLVLNETEQAVIANLVKCGLGVLPMQATPW